MSDSIRKFDINVGANYTGGSALKSAVADVQKLREQLSLPSQGPLNRIDQAVETDARKRIQAMERAAERSRLGEIVNEKLFGGGRGLSVQPYELREYDLKPLEARAEKLADHPDFSGLGGYGADTTRLRGGLSARQGLAAGEEEQQRTLAQQSRGLQRAFRLFGGVAIADQIGGALQKLPQVVEKFHDDIKSGSSRTQAFASALAETLPGVGELAKGFRSLWDVLDDSVHPNRVADRRQREQEQEQRDVRQEMESKRNAKRDPILTAGRDAGIDAGYRASLLPYFSDSAKSIAEAGVALDKEFANLDKLLGQKGALAPEQAELLEKQVGEAKRVATAEYNKKIEEINREGQAKVEADRREHVDRLRGIDEQSNATRLQADGQFFKAKLDAIEEEFDKEKLAAERAAEDAKRDANKDADEEAKRSGQRIEAAQKLRGEKVRAANIEQKRDQQQGDRDFITQRYDTEGELQARRLRLGGKSPEADKLENISRYRDALTQINRDEQEQLKLHAEDADVIKRRAQILGGLAGQDYLLTEAELKAKRAAEYRPDVNVDVRGDVKALTGLGGNSPVLDQNNLLKQQLELAKKAADLQQREVDAINSLVAAINNGSGVDFFPAP